MPSLTCAACSLLVKGDKDEGGGKEAEGRKQLFTLVILMSFDSQICLVFPNPWAEASVKAPPLIILRPQRRRSLGIMGRAVYLERAPLRLQVSAW